MGCMLKVERIKHKAGDGWFNAERLMPQIVRKTGLTLKPECRWLNLCNKRQA